MLIKNQLKINVKLKPKKSQLKRKLLRKKADDKQQQTEEKRKAAEKQEAARKEAEKKEAEKKQAQTKHEADLKKKAEAEKPEIYWKMVINNGWCKWHWPQMKPMQMQQHLNCVPRVIKLPKSPTSKGIRIMVGPAKNREVADSARKKITSDASLGMKSAWVIDWVPLKNAKLS